MRVIVAGNKERGAKCLHSVAKAGHEVVVAIAPGTGDGADAFVDAALALGLKVWRPTDINSPDSVSALRAASADVIVLAGYGPILAAATRSVARFGCLNLHGGRLPEFRGSSPMNWALLRGESEFGISIIEATDRIDAGDVLAEQVFDVGPDETIADLQRRANEAFPELLIDVLSRIEAGTVQRRPQDEATARYFPLRFPDDGLVLWDMLTARQVHDRIRALTRPYPCAYTFHGGRRVQLVRSRMPKRDHRGEPGRVYLASRTGLLVCAMDRCLWIREAVFADDGTDAIGAISRYDRLATVSGAAAAVHGTLAL